uniref:Uncharacterized protein n=1 Tax=Romanomermis culicivorax TaxID=13658 RepID=A0A915IB05_ROMCU
MSANRTSTLARAVRSQLDAKPTMPQAFGRSLIKEMGTIPISKRSKTMIARGRTEVAEHHRRDQHRFDKKLAKNQKRRQSRNLDSSQKKEKTL